MANLTQTTAEVQTILNDSLRLGDVIGVDGSSSGILLFPNAGANTGRPELGVGAPANTDASINSTCYYGFNFNANNWVRPEVNDKALFWGMERNYLPTPGGHFWMEAYLQYQFGDGFIGDVYRRPFMTVIDKNTNTILSTSISGGSSGLSLNLNDNAGTDTEKVIGKAFLAINTASISIGGATTISVALGSWATTGVTIGGLATRIQVGCTTPYVAAFTGNILTMEHATGSGIIELGTNATDAASLAAGFLTFNSRKNTSGTTTRIAQIYASTIGTTANNRGGELAFFTKADGGTDVTEAMRISSLNKVGIGVTAPTAYLHLKACAAAANTASLKIDAGTLASSPVSGNIESDGTHLYWTDSGGTRRTLDNA